MMLRVSISMGASIGVFSALYFLSTVIGAGALAPLVVSAGISAALIRWARLPRSGEPAKPPALWVLLLFFVVLAAAASAFVWLALKEPHGDWDAYSIWNLHARFLERGGAGWTALFSKQLGWSHTDYPLLLPAFVAQIWAALKTETTAVPMTVAFLFTFGAVAVVAGAIRQLRGWNEALIAGAFLLACTDFIVQGAAQYADIPLSFYIVAALALLCFDDSKSTILAGAMAGLAAWTKNEGLLFLVALVAARSIVRWRLGKLAGLTREIGLLAAGAAPVLVVLVLFKFRYAPADELLFSHTWRDTVSRAFDIGRYVTVVSAFVKSIFQVGDLLLPAVLVLAAYGWLVRFKIEPEQRMGVLTVISAVVLMLAGDFAVYALLPNDLMWQINTSIARVFTQIWPAALLGFFLSTQRMELAAPPPAPKKHTKKAAAATRRR